MYASLESSANLPAIPSLYISPTAVGMRSFWEFDATHPRARPSARSFSKTAITTLTSATSVLGAVTKEQSFGNRDERDHTKARFRLLRRLKDNHYQEGAAGARPISVDTAIAFVDQIRSAVPFYATLDDEGYAVLEFEDKSTGLFADITFKNNEVVQCYRRRPPTKSLIFEAPLNSDEVRDFLENEITAIVV